MYIYKNSFRWALASYLVAVAVFALQPERPGLIHSGTPGHRPAHFGCFGAMVLLVWLAFLGRADAGLGGSGGGFVWVGAGVGAVAHLSRGDGVVGLGVREGLGRQ